MAWAELRGLPDASRQQMLSRQFPPPALAVPRCCEGFTRCHLHGQLCVPLGRAVLQELCAVGKFVLLVFWPRVLVLERGKLAGKWVTLWTWGRGCPARSHSSSLLFLLVAGSWTGERVMALFDLSHL